jgi:hypothetical protein
MQTADDRPGLDARRNARPRPHVDPDVGIARGVLVLFLLIALFGQAPGARGQNFALPDAERYFRLEWAAGQNARRGPVIRGYVYETYGRPSDQMRLAIDTLDAGANVTGTTIGYVMGPVPGGGRAYFEIPVPAASGYRVRVLSFRWTHLGGGGP